VTIPLNENVSKKNVTTTPLKVFIKDFDGYSSKNTTKLREAQDKDIDVSFEMVEMPKRGRGGGEEGLNWLIKNLGNL